MAGGQSPLVLGYHSNSPPLASGSCDIHRTGISWRVSFSRDCTLIFLGSSSRRSSFSRKHAVVVSAQQKQGVINVMISGAPASGKGTQCELIKAKYNLVHISTGDLLRAEVVAGTEYGKRAKEYMDQGKLVPDDIVVSMVKDRLMLPDVLEAGWLLDGYPRSLPQAQALEALSIRPELFILLEVPDEILVDRVVGRMLDPVTGKIYHLKYFPPENPEVAARLVHRSDDTEEKVKERLKAYKANLQSVLEIYESVIKRVDGNRPKDDVFADICRLIDLQRNESKVADISTKSKQETWRGIPTKLNNTPHGSEIRYYFYKDVSEAVKNAVEAGVKKMKVECKIPELDTELDVYRAGTLMELIREMAFAFSDDGKRVKVCVQDPMGNGLYRGQPLQLANARMFVEAMDWGDDSSIGTFINFGAVGGSEVTETDDMFIIMAPQNSIGTCIIQDLEEMVNAAGDKPVIIVNPKLDDIAGAEGVMRLQGRAERMAFADTFTPVYQFLLLRNIGTFYPIIGAIRMKYPGPYEVYKRVDEPNRGEKYVQMATYPDPPSEKEIFRALAGRANEKPSKQGFWSWLVS